MSILNQMASSLVVREGFLKGLATMTGEFEARLVGIRERWTGGVGENE